MNLFNPYSYIGAAIVLAAITGGYYYQNREIHHYHELFNAEHDNVTKLNERIRAMLTVQANQSKITETNITKIDPTKETSTIIKEVQLVPITADCTTPDLSKDVKNAF